MAATKSKKKLVKNTSEQAYALPTGTYLAPGEETLVTDWEANAENETVKEWIEQGHLEVKDAPPDPEPEPTEKPAPEKRSDKPKSPER